MTLANLYYQKQEYQKSINILNKIKAKSKSKIAGEKYILQALSYYELEEKEKSIQTIKKALNSPYHKKRAQNIMKRLKS